MERNDYLKAKIDLESKFKNLMESNTETNYINALTKIKNFFNENKVIKNIISNLTEEEKEEIGIDEFLVPLNPMNDFFFKVHTPLNEGVHILVLKKFIDFLLDNHNQLLSLIVRIHPNTKSNSTQDKLLNFSEQVFLPLYNYINDELKKEILVMENLDKVTITQYINGNGNNVNASGRDSNVTIQTSSDVQELKVLLNKALDELTYLKIDTETKAELIDDLDMINEEINCEEVNFVRLRKIKRSIDSFIEGTNNTLEKSSSLISTLTTIGIKIGILMAV